MSLSNELLHVDRRSTGPLIGHRYYDRLNLDSGGENCGRWA
jgi:hypothetical protein